MQHIYPSKIGGEVTIPASKSFTQRALTCALIAEGKTVIRNAGVSDDELAVLKLIQDAGAKVTRLPDALLIESEGFSPTKNLQLSIHESGLATRMLTPVLANSSKQVNLTGKGSILNRPMDFFDEVLTNLDVEFESNQGKLPFDFKGRMVPKDLTIDGSLSSQFITGLIYGYVASPLLKKAVLTIENPTSIPYIELTLEVLKNFGVHLSLQENKIHFNGPYKLTGTTLDVEGDWSSASFLLVAGAIAGEVKVNNLSMKSTQADKQILQALKDFGAQVLTSDDSVFVKEKAKKGFIFDATHCPDLFPPLAVLACYAKSSSRIKGVHRLTHKESNRTEAILSELSKMGAVIRVEGDEMCIDPSPEITSATIDPHGDHRMAMAASVMALGARTSSRILKSTVVNKSFPSFFDLFRTLQLKKETEIENQ